MVGLWQVIPDKFLHHRDLAARETNARESKMPANVENSSADQMRLEVSQEICQRCALPWFQQAGWHLDGLSGQQAAAILNLRAFRLIVEEEVFSSPDDEIRQDRLRQWTYNFSSAFRGNPFSDALPAIISSVEHYEVPRSFLFDTLKAIESSVYGEVIQDWEGLKRYCFRRNESFVLGLGQVLGVSGEGQEYFTRLAVGTGILETILEAERWPERRWSPVPLQWLQEGRQSSKQLLHGRGLWGYPALIRQMAVQAIDQLGDLPEVPASVESSSAVLQQWVARTLEQLHDLYTDPLEFRREFPAVP